MTTKSNKSHTHTSEARAKIAVGQRRSWAERRGLDYKTAAVTARTLMYSDNPDPDLLRQAVDRALRTAPDEMGASWQRVSDALAAGRRIKASTFKVTFITPVDAELVRDIESAFIEFAEEQP